MINWLSWLEKTFVIRQNDTVIYPRHDCIASGGTVAGCHVGYSRLVVVGEEQSCRSVHASWIWIRLNFYP